MPKNSGGSQDETWIQPISSVEKMMNKISIPPTIQAPQQIPAGGNIDILSGIIHSLNSNPYLIGILMLLLNLGGRFLSFELTKKQESFLQQPWLRPFIFFTVIFIATRNLAVAFWITLFFFFIIWVVANENSPFCLIPGWRQTGQTKQSNSENTYHKNIQVLQKVHTDTHLPHVEHTLELDQSEPLEQFTESNTLGPPNDSNTN
jgi:hypothetical protein